MPELRRDPITGRWVIIATERAKRPSDFKVDPSLPSSGFCPFCYGNEERTPPEVLAYRPPHTKPNTPGWSVRVVPNRFPALMIEGDLGREGEGLYDKMNGVGAHEVIIETPDHARQMADLSDKELESVLWAYRDRIVDLKRDRRFRYVMVFKNHGALAGATVEHTHSQLIALPIVPKTVLEEMKGASEYYGYRERCVFCDIIRQEKQDGRRIIYENEGFIVLSPYAPRFPFETWVLPRHHDAAFEDAQSGELALLANALLGILRRMKLLLSAPPYNFMLHTTPFSEQDVPYYHWHFEILPTLSKVAGFEWGSGFYINPTPPEEAARFLREIWLE